MIICHCFAVTDSIVKQHIKNGAKSIADIQKKCNIGTDCGACLLSVKLLLKNEK